MNKNMDYHVILPVTSRKNIIDIQILVIFSIELCHLFSFSKKKENKPKI